jgi:hypothetical protein
MRVPSDTVEALASWLLHLFPGGTVATVADPERNVMVFSITPKDEPEPRSFEATEEALNEHPPNGIIRDLERQRIPALLKRDPTVRPCYSTDRRIPHVECLQVSCDNRVYRVLRDTSHTVVILDASHRRLARLPAGPMVRDDSIFRRPPAEWHRDIRKGRAAKQ